MFDLDQATAVWRRSHTAAGLHSPAVLDELESHLREEIARRVQTGQALPDAFAAAVVAFGSGPALKTEFKKNRSPLQWAYVLLWFVSLVVLWAHFLDKILTFAGVHLSPGYLQAVQRSYDYLAPLCAVSFGILIFHVFHRQPAYRNRVVVNARVALGLIILVVGSIFPLMSCLLIYGSWVEHGAQGALKILPMSLLFLAPGGLLYYFSWKIIRSARARLQSLNQASHV